MGVVNVTPDSFSDGGQFDGPRAAVAHGLALLAQGASILDVGGESTRPGSLPVSTAEQIRRVEPVIRGLRAETGAVISIDTTDAAVAAAALDAGADIVNDISAFRFDDAMLSLLSRRGCPAVAMHTRGAPDGMQDAPTYADVLGEIREHLAERLAACVEAGVARHQVLLDPGIGFGKRLEHNLTLLKGLPALATLGCALVVGTSRKRFLGEITGQPVEGREAASAAAAAVSVAHGAHVVRVHGVAASMDAVRVADAIARAELSVDFALPSP